MSVHDEHGTYSACEIYKKFEGFSSLACSKTPIITVNHDIYKEDLSKEVIEKLSSLKGEKVYYDYVILSLVLNQLDEDRISTLLGQLKEFCYYLIVLERPEPGKPRSTDFYETMIGNSGFTIKKTTSMGSCKGE